jgi:diguanylate cyclase (GGDEF)-like protein
VGSHTSGNGSEGARSKKVQRPPSNAPPYDGAADDELRRAEQDQTLADADQTQSDADQTAADADQSASEGEQEASDRQLAMGGDVAAYDAARDVRARGSEQREQAARERLETAGIRDAVAKARDLEAAKRDEAAALRDRELAARDAEWASFGHPSTGAEVLHRAGEYRKQAAADRLAALEARTRAAADREQAARDRERAAADRARAQRDRDALLQALAIAEIDELTGARTRAAGLADLEREIDRARRTDGRLAVGYIDVVGLKAVNDARGHAAGDALLAHAVHAIRAHLRSYDLIVRMGGDEFLFVMSDATMEVASKRFAAIQGALATDPDPCQVRVGIAALTAADGAAELIERADRQLPTGSRS